MCVHACLHVLPVCLLFLVRAHVRDNLGVILLTRSLTQKRHISPQKRNTSPQKSHISPLKSHIVDILLTRSMSLWAYAYIYNEFMSVYMYTWVILLTCSMSLWHKHTHTLAHTCIRESYSSHAQRVYERIHTYTMSLWAYTYIYNEFMSVHIHIQWVYERIHTYTTSLWAYTYIRISSMSV